MVVTAGQLHVRRVIKGIGMLWKEIIEGFPIMRCWNAVKDDIELVFFFLTLLLFLLGCTFEKSLNLTFMVLIRKGGVFFFFFFLRWVELKF